MNMLLLVSGSNPSGSNPVLLLVKYVYCNPKKHQPLKSSYVHFQHFIPQDFRVKAARLALTLPTLPDHERPSHPRPGPSAAAAAPRQPRPCRCRHVGSSAARRHGRDLGHRGGSRGGCRSCREGRGNRSLGKMTMEWPWNSNELSHGQEYHQV